MAKKKLKLRKAEPKGALDASRLHFYGHSLQVLSSAGLKWARIHADWSITVGRYDGTRGRIPVGVLCSRDRLNASRYIQAVCNGASIEDIIFEVDEYDRELRAKVADWNF
jgi:hypothetical protein